jgi:hypothetical protein
MLLLLQWIAAKICQAASVWWVQSYEQIRALPSVKWTFIATKNVVMSVPTAARKLRPSIHPANPQAPPPNLAV